MTRLVRLILMTGGSVIAMSATAQADPITAAVVGLSTFLASGTLAATVATFAINTALSVGMSLLSKKLQKKQKPVGGLESSADFGVEAYRKVTVGKAPITGRPIYVKGVGRSNTRLHFVWHVGDWEYDGLDAILYNGERKTLTPLAVVGTEDARFSVDGFSGKFVLKFFRGRFPQVADSEIVTASADTQGLTIGPWTAAHRGDGVCLVTGYYDYDEDVFKGGLDTKPVFELRGARLYDPRKDTTAGGSGAHRWSDPATWEYSENPALGAYNYERGFWRNGQVILGKGAGAGDLSSNHYVAAMNVCDENVTEGGQTVKRYCCCVTASAEAEHRTALDAFAASMAADWIEASGLSGPLAGASYAVAMTLTDDDVVEGTAFRYSPDSDTPYNAVSCKFLNAGINWQSDDLVLRTNTAWETEDGGERMVLAVDLQSVSRSHQAARIQEIVHQQSRMTRSCVATYTRPACVLEVGDWVTRNFNRRGFGTITMKVVEKQQHDDCTVTLTLQQCAAVNFIPPSGSPVISAPPAVVPPQTIQTLAGFTFGSSFVEAAGQQRPTLDLGWNAPLDPSVVAVSIEVRLLNNGASTTAHRSGEPESGAFILASDILASATYQARIRPVYVWGGAGTWTAWLSTSTTSYFTVLSSRIAVDTETYFKRFWADFSINPIASALENLERFMADDDAKVQQSRDIMTVANASNSVAATVEELRQVVITGDASLATSISQVSARLASTDLSLTATTFIAQTAQATADTALTSAGSAASVALGAQATANSATASGLFKIETAATSAGALASVAAGVRVATTGGAPLTTFVDAGWVIDVFEETPGVYKGRMAVSADYFAVATASGRKVPFIVTGSNVYIKDLLIAGYLRSDNYIAGERGYSLHQDGSAEFQQITVGGGTSTKRPFALNMGYVQDGVMSDDASVSINLVTTNNYDVKINGSAKRTPTATEYEFTVEIVGGSTSFFSKSIPRSEDVMWSPVMFKAYHVRATPFTSFLYVMVRSDGTLATRYRRVSDGGAVANDVVVDCGPILNPMDLDPTFSLEYNSTDVFVWKDALMQGLRKIIVPATVKVAGVPAPVVGMRCGAWGSGGVGVATLGGGVGAATNYGGPGGHVRNDIAVVPGEVFHFLVGSTYGVGYGGHSVHVNATNFFDTPAGGGTFLWRGPVKRANLELVAGGGGASRTFNGSPGGHTTWAGSNGVAGTGMSKCVGQSSYTVGASEVPGGGGGHTGGGAISSVVGRGGTNYIKTPLNSVDLFSAADANGYATTSLPPGTADAVYVANKTDSLGRGDVGVGGTIATNVNQKIETYGTGMFYLQWLT